MRAKMKFWIVTDIILWTLTILAIILFNSLADEKYFQEESHIGPQHDSNFYFSMIYFTSPFWLFALVILLGIINYSRDPLLKSANEVIDTTTI